MIAAKEWSRSFLTAERAAGGFLAGSLLTGLLAAAIMIFSGAAPGFAAVGGDLAAMAPYAAIFRILNTLYAAAWVVQFPGLALLADLLLRRGERATAVPALSLLLLTAVAGVLHGSFHASVTVWAAETTARTGAVPEIYAPLEDWASGVFRIGYGVHFIAMIGIGRAIARSGLLQPALGNLAAGWSAVWLVLFLLRLGGAPAIPMLMPAVIGAALIVRKADG